MFSAWFRNPVSPQQSRPESRKSSFASSLSSVVSTDTTRPLYAAEKSALENAGMNSHGFFKRMKAHYQLMGTITDAVDCNNQQAVYYLDRKGRKRRTYESTKTAYDLPAAGKKLFCSDAGELMGEDALKAKRATRRKKRLQVDAVSELGSIGIEYGEASATPTGKRPRYIKTGSVWRILGTSGSPEVEMSNFMGFYYDRLFLVKGEELSVDIEVWADQQSRFLYSKRAVLEGKIAKRQALKERLSRRSTGKPQGKGDAYNAVEYYSVKVHKPTGVLLS